LGFGPLSSQETFQPSLVATGPVIYREEDSNTKDDGQ